MRSAKLNTKGKIDIIEIPEPDIVSPDDVKIKIIFASINMDDVYMVNQDIDSILYNDMGNSIGHEMSGKIVDLGTEAQSAGFQIGDRVSAIMHSYCGTCVFCKSGLESHCLNMRFCQTGTLQDYIILNYKQLWHIPSSLSMEAGCMVNTVNYCWNGILRSGLAATKKVMVVGATDIGFIIAQIAKLCGAMAITMVDDKESKLKLAQRLGIEYVVNPASESLTHKAYIYTDKLGYDLAFINVPNVSLLEQTIKVMAPKSTLALTSHYKNTQKGAFSLNELFVRETTVKAFGRPAYISSQVTSLIENLNLNQLVTSVYDLNHIHLALDSLRTGLHIKILIRIN